MTAGGAGGGNTIDNGNPAIAMKTLDITPEWLAIDGSCAISKGTVNLTVGLSPWISTQGVAVYEPTDLDGFRTCDGAKQWPNPVLPNNTPVFYLEGDAMLEAAHTTDSNGLKGFTVDRIATDGTKVWEDVYTTGQNAPSLVAVWVAGNNVYVAGRASQLPAMQPASGAITAHYDFGTGKRDWIRQDALSGSMSPTGVAADAAGNFYEVIPTLSKGVIQKLSPSGDQVWGSTYSVGSGLSDGVNSLHVSPDGDHIVLIAGAHVQIVAFDGEGRFVWGIAPALKHMKVVDGAESIIWSGQSVAPLFAAVSDDGIYLATNYTNSYLHGANPPPGFRAIAVAKLDFSGAFKWGKQYRINPLPVTAGATGSGRSIGLTGVRADKDGNLSVMVSDDNAAGTYTVFKVSADGSVN